MKGDDKGQIEAKTNALQQVAQSLYAAAQAGEQGAAPDAAGASAKAEDVVDAEFTEVKDGEHK
jgi:molecular chaperone DnaK